MRFQVAGSGNADLFRREHGPLVDVSTRLIEQIYRLEGRLLHREAQHLQHNQFAMRAASLAVHLEGALLLAGRALYQPAFAEIRTALEHHAVDQLLFLGNRYEQVLNIDDEAFDKLLRDPSRWPENARAIRRGQNNRKVIEWGSPQVRNEDGSSAGYSMSVYWNFLGVYDPFFPEIPEEEDVFMERAAASDYRKMQRELWRYRLSWRNLRHNLVLNQLFSDQDVRRLHAHYRFLSAYVHPVSFAAWSQIFGRFQPMRYSHYASELALLYICYLGTMEVRAFAQMAEKPPEVELDDWDIVELVLGEAEAISRHGWFPGQGPSAYDRFMAANSQHFRALKEEQPRPEVRPETIKPGDVPYYSNPLARLRDMHASRGAEALTGFSYQSPWPRPEAAFPP